jgi:hypothetical protein
MLNGGGGDVLAKEDIYFDLTLPDEGFYYVQSLAASFNLSGRTVEQVASDDGIWLLKVGRRGSDVDQS